MLRHVSSSWWHHRAHRSVSRLRTGGCGAMLGLLLAACTPSETASSVIAPAAGGAAKAPARSAGPRAVDDARGGRLYDNWRAEKGLEQSFVPDASSSRALDGKGGPNQNGTLNDGSGKPL